MIHPILTIIVPIYNVGKYLSRCIDSILYQDFTDFELILIDDGSSDNSGNICDEYAKKDNRIVVVHQQNKGVSSARNRGLDIARGEYITFIDPDDSIELNTFAPNMELLKNNKHIDLIQISVNAVGKDAKYCYISSNRIIRGDEMLGYWYRGNSIPYAIWGKFFRKKIFEKLRFPEGYILAEDLFLIPDILCIINIVLLSEYGCYNYYCTENSSSSFSLSSKVEIKKKNMLDSYLKSLRYIALEGNNLSIQIEFLENYIRIFIKELLKSENIKYINELKLYIPKVIQIDRHLGLKNNIWIVCLNVLGVKSFIRVYNGILKLKCLCGKFRRKDEI